MTSYLKNGICRMKPVLMIFSLLTFMMLQVMGCVSLRGASSTGNGQPNPKKSMVRVNVTKQSYSLHSPWQRRSPTTHTAIGIIISTNRILVTAELVANHRYVELKKIDGNEKSRAIVDAVDYEANVALLKALDESFMKGLGPFALSTDPMVGDRLTVMQVKSNGDVIPTLGPITSIELTRYPIGRRFLTYRMNGSLQYRFDNVTLPVMKDGKLVGLLMRYNATAQTLDVVPAPVIAHFISDVAKGPYQGFPKIGLKFVGTEDPQLRQYAQIPNRMGGIYITGIIKGSASEKAGLEQGDVVLEIAGKSIDSRGSYKDLQYGKLAIGHLIQCEFHVGETISMKISRNGNIKALDVILGHRAAVDFLVPPHLIDKTPRYYILGGLVLQELSLPYLREYGKDWRVRAPNHFVYYGLYQNDFENDERKKIVFLSRVLPSSFTVGYENLSNLVVTRINDRVIRDLEDVKYALESPVNNFHKVDFEQDPKVIYLDPSEIPKMDRQIRERYRIPVLQNLNNQ